MLNGNQIQKIYALGARLDMVGENGNDLLHELVYNITGCTHISEMNYDQYCRVLADLSTKARLFEPKKKKVKKHSKSPKGMSEGQQRKVWQLMYQLKSCDEQPCTTPIGERLCGIIKKELKIDALPKEPFRWLSYQDGAKLIEIIKNYCHSAEKKHMRSG